MIINYPTGLYQNVLNDSNNITYTVSNNSPPRSNTIILKIPQAIVEQTKQPSEVTYDYKRKAAGTLVYSISKSNRSVTGDNSFQYESGTILEFTTDTTTIQADEVSPDPTIEIQHNSFYTDLQAYGVDADKVAASALSAYRKLSSNLNYYKKLSYDTSKQIEAYQSNINELNRSISSLKIILEFDTSVQTEIDKLNEQLDEYTIMSAEQLSKLNEYNITVDTIDGKLRALAMVVR